MKPCTRRRPGLRCGWVATPAKPSILPTISLTALQSLVYSACRRPWFAGFLLVVFLAVQLAAAAYACAGSRYQMESSGAMAAMTESCPDMAASEDNQGIDQSGLCLAHCQADSKSADHISPQLPAFMPVLMRVIEPTPVVLAEVRVALRAKADARGPPPLNILHCRFQT